MIKGVVKAVQALDVLKREDVLKLIANLSSGDYLKGQGLLVNDKGTNFCCLGVWADQHGCVWHTKSKHGDLVPALPKKKLNPNQGSGTLRPDLAFGLTQDVQNTLTKLNDNSDNWDKVLAYLVNTVLPTAV